MSDTLTKQDLKEVLEENNKNLVTKDELKEALQNYPTHQEVKEIISEAIAENNEQQTRNLGAMFEDNMAKLDTILEHIQDIKAIKAEIETDIKPRLVALEQA